MYRLQAREREHLAKAQAPSVTEDATGKLLVRRGSKLRAPKATYTLNVDGVSYTLPIRRIRSTQVDTKNWGRATFNLDERYVKTGYASHEEPALLCS
jgi:prophage tail gpP-like protein